MTLTVLTLNLSAQLRRSLAMTNAAESLLCRTRQVQRQTVAQRADDAALGDRWCLGGQLAAVRTYIDRLRRLDLRSVGPIAHVRQAGEQA